MKMKMKRKSFNSSTISKKHKFSNINNNSSNSFLFTKAFNTIDYGSGDDDSDSDYEPGDENLYEYDYDLVNNDNKNYDDDIQSNDNMDYNENNSETESSEDEDEDEDNYDLNDDFIDNDYDDEDEEEYNEDDEEEYNEDDEEEFFDEDDEDDEDDEENKRELIKYYDSDESNDSDDDDNDNIFALKLLKKKQRHNKDNKPEEIKKIYDKSIKKLQKKYNNFFKNKDKKYKNLRTFKLDIEDCKSISNKLTKEIKKFKEKFKFKKFYKKCEKLYKYPNEKEEPEENNIFKIIIRDLYKTNTDDKNKSETDKEFEKLYDQEKSSNQSVLKYYKNLEEEDKTKYLDKLRNIKNYDNDNEDINKPNYLKILDINMYESNKSIILQKITTFENLRGSSEYFKLKNWINKVMSIPFGKIVNTPVNKNDDIPTIKNYLNNVRQQLDNGIYGHEATKDQLVKILAHTITNPLEGGNVFALQGPPGVGKTALIQDGIAKALGRPYTFISLGGATDACFLEGHDYTYEGSNHGRIVEVLQQAKCMNPVIYFDELDKVSETAKGEEIINILMHITDSTQNSHFNDKYFGGINIDLSKAIIIFSFNEEDKISRILRDRMKIIRVKGYKIDDKLKITQNYLLPRLIEQIGIKDLNIKISDDTIKSLIDNYTNEGGVRKIKELLNDILLEINLRRLEDNKINGKKIKNKLELTFDIIKNEFLRKKRKLEHISINNESRVGIVNGLWANELGMGGLIPIECCWIPASEKLNLELTGMQGKVMKESMSVARTIAWRILPNSIKKKLNNKWKNTFDYGIHIHCPDGATPKDGPSAGGAITTCLISLLSDIPVNNKIAMTGEINLKGQITAIGGLEEKIFGAKKAGAELVLCPKENEHDLNEIKDKFPKLFNNNFKAKIIENIWDILNIALLKKEKWSRFD